MLTRFRILVILSCVLACPIRARAEVFVLTNGGRIEGSWVNRETEPLVMYEIAMSGGGRLTLATDQVERVIVKSENMRRYEEALRTLPDKVEAHWDMAEKCRKAGLKPQRQIHLRRILELSPDHEDARHALGFSRVDGEWVKPDEWLAKQGYVRHKGSWRLPQEVELDTRREQRNIEEQQWRQNLKQWRASIVRNRNDSAQAFKKLQATDSAYAIAPIAELLGDKKEPKPLKLVYIDILSRFNNANAAAALLERVMTDPDLEIRERSIAALQNHGREQALAMLTRSLKDNENHVVNVAAWALGRLGDPAAIPALIDAVVTKHKRTVFPGGAPGGINAGMGAGGGGLQMGGRPVRIEETKKNPQVLSALTALTPDGVNFGYNELAWKNWWAQQQTVPGYNLRRDL